MSKLHTLTVPDIQWINLQITGKPQKYDFAKLEEGTFYQYKSGSNSDLPGQAANFLIGFSKLKPLEKGNTATAFVGCIAFLQMNNIDFVLDPAEAHAWFRDLENDRSLATKGIELASKSADNDGHDELPNSRKIIGNILERYQDCLKKLAKEN